MNFPTLRIISFLVLLFFAACSTKNSKDQSNLEGKYSIYAMMKDGKEFLVQTDSLSSGYLNPELAGTPVVPDRLFYDLIVKDGYYYRVDWKTKTFVKHQLRDGKFTQESQLNLKGISSIENYSWISRDSLLIIGFDEDDQVVRFAKIQVKEMQAVQGQLPLPKPEGIFNSMSVGFSRLSNDTLLVGYTYHTTTNLNSYTTSDTMYVEALTYPGMKSISRSKDNRSAYPGGPNTRQSHSFTDEKGDFYFIACPGIASGNNPAKPTGIFRIKKSQTAIDPGYFFNISGSAIQNHGYGFWYIGNGKAVVRTERKGIFTGMKDHWKVPHFDLYVLDLQSHSVSRLDLPLDKGTVRQCVLQEDGTVYITINSDAGGSYVWIYNPGTGSLKKGLRFDSQVDYVLRLERLH